MNTLYISSASAVGINIFGSLESVAKATLPYLTHGSVGLSGGTTITALFPLWLHLKPDCSSTSFFPVDERIVPFEDTRSNWGNACRLFLNHIGKSSDKAHAALSADQYSTLLQRNFTTKPPVFDVIFLGMGKDGHTASLFPEKQYEIDPEIYVLETLSPVPPPHRISLSPAVLAAAKKLIIIIAGEDKAAATAGIFKKNKALPIVQVVSQRRDSIIYIEQQIYDASRKE